MATYIVGDVHGCFDELQLLLNKANFNSQQDELWLVGDIMAMGPKSLDCIRFVRSLGDKAKMVLGNHELHFLATAYGIKPTKDKENVANILTAEDSNELINWIRNQPLLIQHPEHKFVITHAGISPAWDLATAKSCAKEVEAILQHGDYKQLLTDMYGKKPDEWDPNLQGIDRLRYTINAFTRMRYCYANHRLDFDCKKAPQDAPAELQPWFLITDHLSKQCELIFGHWASLVDYPTPANIYAMDSGCVWGNQLKLLCWETKQYFYQDALKTYHSIN